MNFPLEDRKSKQIQRKNHLVNFWIHIKLRKRELNMSILSSIRDTYNQIPKEPAIAPKDPVVPTNQDLMDKVMSNLDKNPQIATKVQ